MRFVPLNNKLVWPFELVQPIKIDGEICALYLVLIALLSSEIVKPPKIAKGTNFIILSPLVAVVEMIKLA